MTIEVFRCPICGETAAVSVSDLIVAGVPYCTLCMDAGYPEPEMLQVRVQESEEESGDTPLCDNGPCEAEAVMYYVTEKGARFYLCQTCGDAFELGQVNPDAATSVIGSEEDDEDA